MNERDVLRGYRLLRKETDSLRAEIMGLESQLGACKEGKCSRRLSFQENKSLLRLRALRTILSEEETLLDSSGQEAEAIVDASYPLQLRSILRQYYLAGRTDEAIAESLDLSSRQVNKLRNAFLHERNRQERLQNAATPTTHQKGWSHA